MVEIYSSAWESLGHTAPSYPFGIGNVSSGEKDVARKVLQRSVYIDTIENKSKLFFLTDRELCIRKYKGLKKRVIKKLKRIFNVY